MVTGERAAYSLISGSLLGAAPAVMLAASNMPQAQASLGVATLILGGALISLAVNGRDSRVSITEQSAPVPETDSSVDLLNVGVGRVPKKRSPEAELKREHDALQRFLAQTVRADIVSARLVGDYVLYDLRGLKDQTTGRRLALSRNTLSSSKFLVDLADFLTRLRGQPVQVAIDPPTTLRVPNREQKPFAFADVMRLPVETPSKVVVGQYYSSGQVRAASLDLFDGQQSNCAIVGMPGSGKTVQMYNILLQMMLRLGPGQLHLYVVDAHDDGFMSLAGAPHVRGIVAEPGEFAEAAALVRHVRVLCENRRRSGDNPHIVLAIDELALLLANKDVGELVAEDLVHIASTGRKKHVHLLLVTQAPRKNALPSELKDHLHVKISGAVGTGGPAQYVATYFGIDGADTLRGNGDMFFQSARYRAQIQVKAPLVTAKDTQDVIHAVVDTYGPPVDQLTSDSLREQAEAQRRVPVVVSVPEAQGAVVEQLRGPSEADLQTERWADILRPYFADLFNADGSLQDRKFSSAQRLLKAAGESCHPRRDVYEPKIEAAGRLLAQEVA